MFTRPTPVQGVLAVTQDAAVYILSPKNTKSLDRAKVVISYLRTHTDPVSVREISDECNAFYEETLHILATLEALGLVERYSRDGSPREGPRVAYSWRIPSSEEQSSMRERYKRDSYSLGG